MVYIKTGNNIFPKVEADAVSKILFINQTTKSDFDVSAIDISDSNNYYKFNFSSSDLGQFEVGLYDYYIVDSSSKVHASGIAQFGNYVATHSQYDTSLNIIQYNS